MRVGGGWLLLFFFVLALALLVASAPFLGPCFMGGLRIFGDGAFLCVASYPFPCRYQFHTTLACVLALARSSFCGDLCRFRCSRMCCNSRGSPTNLVVDVGSMLMVAHRLVLALVLPSPLGCVARHPPRGPPPPTRPVPGVLPPPHYSGPGSDRGLLLAAAASIISTNMDQFVVISSFWPPKP